MKLDKVKPARRKSGWISKLFERLLIAIKNLNLKYFDLSIVKQLIENI